MSTVTLLLRTLDAAPWLPPLLERLAVQTLRPLELLVVDSESGDDTRERLQAAGPLLAVDGVRIVTLPRGSFTHARSTNLGFHEARGDIVVMLSQDALPSDERWLERLTAPLAADRGDGIAAAFGRQLPRPGCFPLERWQLETDYPAAPHPGVPYSNVNSAAWKSAWRDEPFDETLRIAEDRAWAGRQQARGRRIAYVPEAAVLHSHEYSVGQAAARCAEESRARLQSEGTGESVALLFKAWPRQTLRDLARLRREGDARLWPRAAIYRLAQFWGMWRGGRITPPR